MGEIKDIVKKYTPEELDPKHLDKPTRDFRPDKKLMDDEIDANEYHLIVKLMYNPKLYQKASKTK